MLFREYTLNKQHLCHRRYTPGWYNRHDWPSTKTHRHLESRSPSPINREGNPSTHSIWEVATVKWLPFYAYNKIRERNALTSLFFGTNEGGFTEDWFVLDWKSDLIERREVLHLLVHSVSGESWVHSVLDTRTPLWDSHAGAGLQGPESLTPCCSLKP